MADDFVQFNLDRPPKTDVKSNEQIHCHSVGKAEDYPPLEKSVFILMIGEEIQKLSVIQNIPELIKEDYEGCLSKIIPKMNQGLVQGSIEYHLAASKSVQKILKQNAIQPVHFKVHFLKTVLKSMDNRDPDTAKTWLDTLLEAIRILKEDVIVEEILPVAEAKSRHTEPVFHRIMACRMLGRIAEYCSTYTVQKCVLGSVQALCQDVDKGVRAAMCLQLSALTHPLLATYDRDLLPLLNDCVNDEQIEVRAAAYCALVHSLALVNQDILKQSFLPMAKKIIEQCLQTVQDGIFLIDLTEQYGNLCLGLEPVMKEQDKIWFAEAYLKLADLASSVQMKFKERVMDRGRMHAQSQSPHNNSIFVDSRVNCALNMPNIIRFCRGIGNSNAAYFTRNIYPLMCMLCSDSQYAVRRAIASVMHELTATLGKSNGFILKEFIKLLNDDSEDVLQALIPNIKKCLQSFSESENFSPDVVDDKSIELTRSLFACESEVLATYNWRLQTEYFKQLEVLMRCLPSSFIYSQFVQLLRKRLFTYRTVDCRVAIVRTLLVFLRYNSNMNQRTDIRNSIITDLCCSKNFYNRSIYVRSIPNILEIFSSSYFRTHFFTPTIALMEDKVANIRFMMCDLMPMMKCIAACEKNSGKYLAAVDAAIQKTSFERDRLVLEHIATMKKKLDKVKLDDKDSSKLKEEKILDAIAANAKDVKSQFPNLGARSAPIRTPPRTFDVQDMRSASNRSLDSRHGDSAHLQQPLTLDCSPAPASPAGTSGQLSPDIIAYDTYPKFHQTYSSNNGAAMDDFSPNINFENFDQLETSRSDNSNSPTFCQAPSNDDDRNQIVSNSNFDQILAARNELVQNSSFQNFDKIPKHLAAASNELVRNSSFQNFDKISIHVPANNDHVPNFDFKNYYQLTSNGAQISNPYQFPSHEADRNNDIIPNLNFPSFNHVPCSEVVGYDLDTNANSQNSDQVSLNNNGSSSHDLSQNLIHVRWSGNDLGQNLTAVAQNSNFQNFYPASNDSVPHSNFSNSNQIPANQVAGNGLTQNSNSIQISANEVSGNDLPSTPNARCMSPDIIKNSKSSLIGNLPDIALNHATSSPELHENNVGEIEGQIYENYDSNNTGYVIENSSVAYIEEGRVGGTDDVKNKCSSNNQSTDALAGNSIESHENKNLFVRRSSLGYLEERLNDSSNNFTVENSSNDFQEGFLNRNKKSNFVRNSSMKFYLDENVDHKTYDSYQRHETYHKHGGKVFESRGLEDNVIRHNETYDPSNSHIIINDKTTSNPLDNIFLHSNEIFEPRPDVQNMNKNHNISRNSRKFKINSSNLLNNNFETTAPAVYTYSYINEDSTSSSLSDNLEIDSINLQNNNLETSVPIYNSNELEKSNLLNRIENIDTRLELEGSSILTNHSPLYEERNDVRNLEDKIVDELKVDIHGVETLEKDEKMLWQASKKPHSSSLLQNYVPDNLSSKNTMSVEIIAENITSENDDHEFDKINSDSSSVSKASVHSSEESYPHASNVSRRLSSTTILNNNEANINVSHLVDETIIVDNETGNNICKEKSHVIDIDNNQTVSNDTSESNLENIVESIVPPKSESNIIEKHRVTRDQSLLKKVDIIAKDQNQVSNVNKSPVKLSKNTSSCIPTISKSPRRSLVLDSDCTSGRTSIPSMNARRSLVFDSGCTSDHSSIPSIKKSQRNSLNFDGNSGFSIQNKCPRFSLVGNDSNNTGNNLISKPDPINSFGLVKSSLSTEKILQKAGEPRKHSEITVLKRSNEKSTSLACLQKTGEIRTSCQSLVSKRFVDKIPVVISQSTFKSPVSKLSNKKTTGEGFDEVKETLKLNNSPLLERSSTKMSQVQNVQVQNVEEPKVIAENHVSEPYVDEISGDGFQNVGEPENPSFSKLKSRKMSEDVSLTLEESKTHSESQVSKISTNKLSEADSLKVEESKKLPQTPSSKLDSMFGKISVNKPEDPKKSSQSPILKRGNVQVPQKSFLPIRASKNVPSSELICDESQVSKRHSLGTLSSDNEAVISKQLIRKSAGRPQSLVISSSRLPVRSGNLLPSSRSPR